MRGPIDFIIVSFKGPKFDGSILQALGDALDKGIIGLVGLSLLAKDAEGTVTSLNVADVGDKYITDFAQKYPATQSEVDQDDIDETAELLEPDTAAGLLMIEHLWALPLKEAIINANGVLLAEGRIHPEAAAAL
jgi:hypothetical protein